MDTQVKYFYFQIYFKCLLDEMDNNDVLVIQVYGKGEKLMELTDGVIKV